MFFEGGWTFPYICIYLFGTLQTPRRSAGAERRKLFPVAAAGRRRATQLCRKLFPVAAAGRRRAHLTGISVHMWDPFGPSGVPFPRLPAPTLFLSPRLTEAALAALRTALWEEFSDCETAAVDLDQGEVASCMDVIYPRTKQGGNRVVRGGRARDVGNAMLREHGSALGLAQIRIFAVCPFRAYASSEGCQTPGNAQREKLPASSGTLSTEITAIHKLRSSMFVRASSGRTYHWSPRTVRGSWRSATAQRGSTKIPWPIP